MDRNSALLDMGRRYLKEANYPKVRYAFVGGSVGRGNADEFSDIDITVCVDERSQFQAKNLIYEGEFVQVHCTSPISVEAIREIPLEYRFLLESKTLYDPFGEFAVIQHEASKYLNSTVGKRDLFSKWAKL